jgi:signal transduction histidine kinase
LRVNLLTKSTPRQIEIKDDGVGFIPDKTQQGLGTLLLRSLSGEAGAEVSIETRADVGTTVTVRLS